MHQIPKKCTTCFIDIFSANPEPECTQCRSFSRYKPAYELDYSICFSCKHLGKMICHECLIILGMEGTYVNYEQCD